MSVVSHTNAAGDVSIGIYVEGAFVPVVTVPAYRVAHYVERGKLLQARAEADDPEALAVLGKLYVEPKKARGKAAAEGED